MSVVKKTSGVALALAAATLMGCAAQSDTKVASAETAEIHCAGVNACKGHNDCKTAENACKGQAACKGHGFLSMAADACAKVGGTVTK